eukprot:5980757-Amphidinium_carterae.1
MAACRNAWSPDAQMSASFWASRKLPNDDAVRCGNFGREREEFSGMVVCGHSHPCKTQTCTKMGPYA